MRALFSPAVIHELKTCAFLGTCGAVAGLIIGLAARIAWCAP
jgi:hypothetical protein